MTKRRTTFLPAYTREYITDWDEYVRRYGPDNPWVQWAQKQGVAGQVRDREMEGRVPETYDEWVKRMSYKEGGDAA